MESLLETDVRKVKSKMWPEEIRICALLSYSYDGLMT
jgi:hypothetical protein